MTDNANNLFYLCSLIENISRMTFNTKKDIIDKIGKKELEKIYSLAEVYHCEPLEKISEELIIKFQIENGDYQRNIFKEPTAWDIGKVFQRLIIMVNNNEEQYIETLIKVLKSWIIPKIDNYESSLYYESPEYIYTCYKEGKII